MIKGVSDPEVAGVSDPEVAGVSGPEVGVSVERYPHPSSLKTCQVLLTFLGAVAKCKHSCKHVQYCQSADLSFC